MIFRFRLLKKAENSFEMGYDPELDNIEELDLDAASYYLTIIGVPRWMIELGRIDIIMEVSLYSSHVALPREGHLGAAMHVMAHVGQRYNFRLVYDSSYPEIDHSVFKKYDWLKFHRMLRKIYL